MSYQPTFVPRAHRPIRRWSMHAFGKYKFINLTFGILPFIATMLIATMNEHSSPARLWFSIVRKITLFPGLSHRILILHYRFHSGSAMPSCCRPCSVSSFEATIHCYYTLIFQLLFWPTYPVRRVVHLFTSRLVNRPPSESAMAVGTGFGLLFRCVGQVGGPP